MLFQKTTEIHMEILRRADIITKIVDGGLRVNSDEIIKEIEPLVKYYNGVSEIKAGRNLNGSKKVALVIPYNPLYETGGLEVGTRKLAESLSKIGNNVEIVSRGIYPDKNLSGTLTSPEGIKVQGVGSGIEEIVPYLLNRNKDFDVIQWMEIFPPIPEKDSVFNDKAEQQYLASVVFRSYGIHTFLYVATSGNVTNRGVNNPKWPNFINQKLNSYLTAGIEGFNVINSEIPNEYESAGVEIGHKQFEVVPLGVDADKFTPVNNQEKKKLRELLGLPEDKTIFICPGRFVNRKRQDLLLSVWTNTSETIRSSSTLLFVGGAAGKGQPDSTYNFMTESIGKHQESGDRSIVAVDLVTQDQMVKYFQASDAMIFPSEREGLGMVVLEAMACGIPVFASNISGVRDIIISDDMGTLFEPNNQSQLENCIVSFLRSPNTYSQRATKAREFVNNNWSWESVGNKLNSFYERF